MNRIAYIKDSMTGEEVRVGEVINGVVVPDVGMSLHGSGTIIVKDGPNCLDHAWDKSCDDAMKVVKSSRTIPPTCVHVSVDFTPEEKARYEELKAMKPTPAQQELLDILKDPARFAESLVVFNASGKEIPAGTMVTTDKPATPGVTTPFKMTEAQTALMRDWLNRPSMLVPLTLHGYPSLWRNLDMVGNVVKAREKSISLAHPPSVSVKVRDSGSVVVTVNLSRGGFTCFLRPVTYAVEENAVVKDWHFGFAFRAPTDEPSSKGKELAAHRCGTRRSLFSGVVYTHDRDRGSQEHLVRILVLRALRSLRKSGALGNVRWWTKESMDQAVKLLKEGTKADGTFYFKVTE